MSIKRSDIIAALTGMSGVTHSATNGSMTVQISSDSEGTVNVEVNRLTGICTSNGQVVETIPTREISEALPSSILPREKKR